MNTLFIGADGEQVVDSKETMMQIEEVKALQCDLVTDDGEPLTWDMFDNPDNFEKVKCQVYGRVEEISIECNQNRTCHNKLENKIVIV